MSRYYIVNFTDASLLRTEDSDRAKELAASDEMLVIDTQTDTRLSADATVPAAPIPKLTHIPGAR